MKVGNSVRLVLAGVLLLTPLAMEGSRSATKKTAPSYPALARRMRVAGTVKLEVKVAATGKVQEIKVVNGHPLLSQAAKECVSQWQFAPADADSTEIVELEFNL